MVLIKSEPKQLLIKETRRMGGLCRMFQIQRDGASNEIEIFRKLEDGFAYLNLDEKMKTLLNKRLI